MQHHYVFFEMNSTFCKNMIYMVSNACKGNAKKNSTEFNSRASSLFFCYSGCGWYPRANVFRGHSARKQAMPQGMIAILHSGEKTDTLGRARHAPYLQGKRVAVLCHCTCHRPTWLLNVSTIGKHGGLWFPFFVAMARLCASRLWSVQGLCQHGLGDVVGHMVCGQPCQAACADDVSGALAPLGFRRACPTSMVRATISNPRLIGAQRARWSAGRSPGRKNQLWKDTM